MFFFIIYHSQELGKKKYTKIKPKQYVFDFCLPWQFASWTLLWHTKKPSWDFWISVTAKRCVKISLRRLCESFDTRVHCDLAAPVGATSRGTSKSKTLLGSILTGWLNAEAELGAFYFSARKRKKEWGGGFGQSIVLELRNNNVWGWGSL